ncbi:ArsR family transcriptional regulator [Deinococcus wulumuqiensis]|uniref:ArsR family transcriptional regulator n=1 Tax=Deinococcus wulumuqiensis TaxID=980427 RepID=A0A345IJ88_9DEIO|nr:winged helix-turn-helix domain-containing protein [Deinococcus wulumuqiensis]AXG99760.1 ArsR family transcriptional regulator [Deinococcus wulumuqiensis]
MTDLPAHLTVTDPAAARALRQDFAFLSLFTAPVSPSDVAQKAGMAANLAHHHARKLADLGLLQEQRREGGKVFYRLAAWEFRVPSDLLPAGELPGEATMKRLSAGFLRAYEKCWAQTRGGEEDVFGFGTPQRPADLVPSPPLPSDAPYPTHADMLTLHLTPERYRRLARDLSRLLSEAAAEGISEQGERCTLAVLGFAGSLGPEVQARGVSRGLDSFLGAE